MNDLISRKALLEVAEHNVEFQEGIVDVYILESILAGMPAIDVTPVVHGRWVKPHWHNSASCANCSVCGTEASHHIYRGVQQFYKICPYCGAKMDGGNDND